MSCEDQGPSTGGLRTEDRGPMIEDGGPRNEDSLRPTENTLADLLVLKNSVGPGKPPASLQQFVPAWFSFKLGAIAI